MVSEICLLTGWRVREVLEMPARQFFAVRKSMLESEHRRKIGYFLDLIDIQAISIADVGYIKELKNHFKELLLTEDQREARSQLMQRIFRADDKNQSLMAARVLASAIPGNVKGFDG